jgi:hypothetical protein
MATHDGASHPRNGHDMKSAEGAVAVPNTMAAQTPLRRGADSSNKTHEAVRAKPASAASATQLAHAASVPEAGRGIVVGATAGRPETAKPIERRMSADRSITRARDQLAARKDGRHVDMQRHLADGAAVSHRRYAAVDASSIAAQATAPRTIVKPSVAGAYSPLRPAQLGTHDYASMDMSAGVGSSGRAQAAQMAQMAQSAQWSQVAEEVQQARDAERRRDAQDAQPIEKAQRGKPAQQTQQAKPVQPAQQAKPAQDAQQAQDAQHPRDAQDAQRIQQAQQAKPIQQAQEPKPAQPAQQAKPAQQAQQPQPPSSANPSPNTSPQWINRLSQRRVTEVPDQFTR